jgi:glutamate-1-semialdehyde 2,1-aminomutase
MTTSEQLFEKSKQFVPGGVHSPVRSFKGLNMVPRFIEKGKGAIITDVSDNEYIDFCMSFGPLLLGHANDVVLEKLHQALERGWSFGAAERYSLELSEYLVERIPFVDQIRLVNSGTEAVMTALRLARGATGRSKIIKFNGCYHGHTDSMLIKAGSGLAGEADASSQGVTPGTASDTLILELGDIEGIKECFEREKGNIAAIIVEPLPANNGLLIQEQSFLEFLREITTSNDSLLIFDEVISGFRVGFGGMAGETGITPDLVTYGKIIGGGLPVGAVCGKKDIMENLAPIGGVYQAGTLSANPLAMIGGLETLKLLTPDFYQHIHNNTQHIVKHFENFFSRNEAYSHLKVIQKSSLFWITPGSKDIKTAAEIPADLFTTFTPLFDDLIKRGIYIAPNPYEVGFVSGAHDHDIIETLKEKLS